MNAKSYSLCHFCLWTFFLIQIAGLANEFQRVNLPKNIPIYQHYKAAGGGGGWGGGGAFPSTVERNKSWAVALNPGQPWSLGALAMSGDLLGCHDPGREWG